jgi:hypothetical protein
VIRVDPPSNLVSLESDSGLLSPSMTGIPIELFSPTERAEMGNKSMHNPERYLLLGVQPLVSQSGTLLLSGYDSEHPKIHFDFKGDSPPNGLGEGIGREEEMKEPSTWAEDDHRRQAVQALKYRRTAANFPAAIISIIREQSQRLDTDSERP